MDGLTGIILCTVPHTGTHFFCDLLEQHFPRVGKEETLTKDGYHPLHVYEDHLAWIKHNRGRIHLITTTRNLTDLRASWLKRGRNHAALDRALVLHRELMTLGPYVVSFDNDCERRLKGLEDLLGVRFKTDWTPKNEWPAS